MYNAGDFQGTETVVIPFNTFSSDDPSASVTITDLANTDIEIHKDGSTTQRSSDSGVAVVLNFDSITGNHVCTIDISDNDDDGFYASGSTYLVRMEGTTVDGATINAWIGGFSIGKMQAAMNAALVALDLDHLVHVAEDDTPADNSIIAKIASTDGDWSKFAIADDALQSIRDHIGDGTNLTEAGGDGDHLTEAGGDGDQLTALPWNSDWDAEVESEVDDALGSGTGTALTAIPWNADWDAEVQSEVDDALKALNLDHLLSAADDDDVADNSVIGKLASTDGDWSNFVDTTDSLQSIRDHIGDGTNLTEAGGDGDHLTEAGGDGDQLTAVPWNADWDAEVESECADALVAIDLDHLVNAAEDDTPADNSIIAKLAATDGDWSNFAIATDALQSIRDHIGDGANLTEAGGDGDQLAAVPWNSDWDAEVESECTDALKALALTQGTYAPQEAPPVDATLPEALAYLYKAFRNKSTVTADTYTLYADDASTADQTATLSDDDTTFTRGELGSGA